MANGVISCMILVHLTERDHVWRKGFMLVLTLDPLKIMLKSRACIILTVELVKRLEILLMPAWNCFLLNYLSAEVY